MFVVDTNVLLDDLEKLAEYDNLVILSHVIRELDKHKSNRNADLAFRARKATRFIYKNKDKFKFDLQDYVGDISGQHDTNYVDNKIIDCCMFNGYGLISKDILLLLKAQSFGVPFIEIENNVNSNYAGVKDVYIDKTSDEGQRLLADIYEVPEHNYFDLVHNEYVVLWDKSRPMLDEDMNVIGYEVIDKFKWNNKLVKLKYKGVNSKFLGKIKPVNVKQELMFDLMQNDSVTVKTAFGKYGTGKDFVMISHAIELLESNKIEKIIWVRNNVELKDTQPIGFLPGDKDEKLIEWALPLADHLGGIDGLKMFMDRQKIEIQHLGTLRGRDIKNSIIYCTESQNNTKDHVKLLLGRVGQGSQLWLNGDMKQVDNDKYLAMSGLQAVTRLGGHQLYGQVMLDKTERSETASLAEMIE